MRETSYHMSHMRETFYHMSHMRETSYLLRETSYHMRETAYHMRETAYHMRETTYHMMENFSFLSSYDGNLQLLSYDKKLLGFCSPFSSLTGKKINICKLGLANRNAKQPNRLLFF
jgi:hypothetical protein